MHGNFFRFLILILLTGSALRGSCLSTTALAVKVYGQVKDSLVIIRGTRGSGSGFIVREDGRTWLYTNEHVARCGKPVSAKFIDGRNVEFVGTLEVAENRDLVRISVASNMPALKLRADAPLIDEPVFVFGNSDGGGVLTKIVGKVLGVGDEKLETDAKFVHGNSGSAMLDAEGRVVAVATQAERRQDPEDWVKAGTRFDQVRRYGMRCRGVHWKPVEWTEYAQAGRWLQDFDTYRQFLIPVCFKEKKLVTDYAANRVRKELSIEGLKAALARMMRQDAQYLKVRDEFEKILEKRKATQPGMMAYPNDQSVNIRYKKYRRELLESILERKAALQKAVSLLSSSRWPCRRMADDAHALCEGFKYYCAAYDQINADELSEIDWKPD